MLSEWAHVIPAHTHLTLLHFWTDNARICFQRKQGTIDQEGLGAMADELLKNKSINQWWIPDSVERQVYVNCLKLVFCLLDKVADTLSIRWVSFASRARRKPQGGQF
jgi:hypothetical protein